MKKILNNNENLVKEMCNGMVKSHGNLLDYDEKYNLLSRKVKKTDKVVIISGGGSGHEPAHAGFVGKGMLDCAVCGEVFASPSVMQIYNAIKDNATEKGVLLIVKNYSGDVMNFDNAADLAIDEDDLKVDSVCVNDDVAIKKEEDRRGVAGTIFVHKIAGAKAETGASLEEVKRVAQKVIKNVRSMGIALNSCTVPARGKPTFDLEEDKIEMGVGIHGEAGIKREDTMTSKEIASRLLKNIVEDLKLYENEECALIVNGFGATPLQELYILTNDVMDVLKKKNITVFKSLIGNYMTSIDMAGASISLLRLDGELKKYLCAPSNTLSWKEP